MRIRRSVAIWIGALGWMPRLLPLITAVDLRLQRLTRGRIGLLDLADLPHLTLIVPGRRSGIARSTPLLCVPRADRWLIAGSNFGQPRQPAWVPNLVAAEEAVVVWKGRRTAVTATELIGDERATAWAEMTATWPNFSLYEKRTARRIRVFELRPAEADRTRRTASSS